MYGELLILLIALSVNRLSAGESLTKVTKFDDYAKVLAAPIRPEVKLRVIEAVWAETSVDFAGDIVKITNLYDNLRATFSSSSDLADDTAQAAAELEQELCLELVRLNGELLAKAIRGKQYPNDGANGRFSELLFEHYDTQLVHKIYNQAIELSYDVDDVHYVSAKIYKVSTGDERSLEIMTQAQLQLFWKYQNLEEVNNEFVFNIGYYFRTIKRHPNYKELPKHLSERLENSIKALPSTVRHFYFDSFVTVKNGYTKFAMFMSDRIVEKNKRLVLTRYLPDEEYEWILNINEVLNEEVLPTLEVSFFSNILHMPAYRETDSKKYVNKTMAWLGEGIPELAIWTPSYKHNDAIIFRQDTFVLCESYEYHLRYYRFAESYGQWPNASDMCSWKIDGI